MDEVGFSGIELFISLLDVEGAVAIYFLSKT